MLGDLEHQSVLEMITNSDSVDVTVLMMNVPIR